MRVPEPVISKLLGFYIEEDAFYGDCTPLPEVNVVAEVVAKESFVLSGVEFASAVFRLCRSRAKPLAKDGEWVERGEVLLEVEGESVLTAERVALNVIQRMSGIATATRKLVDIAEKYGVRVAATRKTTPGFRLFEKIAVMHGGGDTHRMSLSDCVLLKDNHLAVFGSIEKAVEFARKVSFTKKVEVEVSSVEDAVKAARAGADIVMLDNMKPKEVERAVREIRKVADVTVEASGGITPENVESYAKTGVDVISSGWITHSAKAVDVSMRVVDAG